MFSSRGEHIVTGKLMNKGLIFYVPSNMAYKLSDENADESLNGPINQVNVIKNLTFLNNAQRLLQGSADLQSIILMLQKNKDLNLTISTHTDSKPDDKAAMDLTIKQAKQ